MPASWTPVRPSRGELVHRGAQRALRFLVGGAGCDARSATSAVSTNTPVGCPAASRTIWPPCGIRRRRRDAGHLQRRAVHPDGMAIDARQNDGTILDDGVEIGAVGNCCPFHSTWFQPRPTIQRASGLSAANLRTRSSATCSDAAAQVDLQRSSPSPMTCPCASMRPGSNVLPRPSMTVAPCFAGASLRSARARPCRPRTRAGEMLQSLAGRRVAIHVVNHYGFGTGERSATAPPRKENAQDLKEDSPVDCW